MKKIFGIFLVKRLVKGNPRKDDDFIEKLKNNKYFRSKFEIEIYTNGKEVDYLLFFNPRDYIDNISLIQKDKIKCLIRDTGWFSIGGYWSLGYNGYKGHGEFFNQNSPSDRFDGMNLTVSKMELNNNDNILFLLSRPPYSVDPSEFCRIMMNSINYILTNTRYNIVCKHHPQKYDYQLDFYNNCFHNILGNKRVKFIKSYKKKEPDHIKQFDEFLKYVYCTVSFSSYSAIHSIRRGIPNISLSTLSPAYKFSNHKIEDIHNLTEFPKKDVYQWFCDLAYCNWTNEEINTDIPYERMLRKIENDNE